MSYQIYNPSRATLIRSAEIKSGWKLRFFLTGTSTPTDVYTTAARDTPHAQPIVADSGGRMPVIYLDPSIVYKCETYDENDVLQDTDDPVNDSVLSSDAINDLLTQAGIGAALYPRTAAEISAGVTPTNYAYPELDVRRYGFAGDANSSGTAGTDDTTAIQTAINVANAGFLGGSYGGAGGVVVLPAARFRHTGLTIKKGVSLRGQGSLNTVGFLVGASATALKCAAVDTDSSADQVSYGFFEGIAFASAESTPVAQVQWDAIGFNRWKVRDVLFTWCGGQTGIKATDANPASLGGPAQWYNELTNVELLHVGPNGGVGALLGNADTTYEGVTTWIWYGGRCSSNGTGTGRSFAGAIGCQSFGFVTEGCGSALVVGEASGARTAVSNTFVGEYYEANTINRDIKATAYGTAFFGSFITGGADSDNGVKTTFAEYAASEDWKIPAGLKFSSTSTDATALDYYGEANFTPGLTFATPGTLATVAGGSNAGKYTRIGNMVQFDLDLDLSTLTLGTASGSLRVTGLPFAAAATACCSIGFHSAVLTYAASRTYIVPQVIAGQQYIEIQQHGTGVATSTMTAAEVTGGSGIRIQISGSYRV